MAEIERTRFGTQAPRVQRLLSPELGRASSGDERHESTGAEVSLLISCF